MRVAHSVGLAATRLTAHDEAPVPEGGTLTQDVRQVDALLDVVGDIHAREAVGTAFIEEALDLTVQAVPKLLKQDVHVGDVAGMLADGGNGVEDVGDVREVEVTADGEALGAPVAAADHGVYVGQATLARRAIAQVSHEAGASEGQVALGIGCIGELLCGDVSEGGVDGVEDLLDGGGTFGALAEEIFVTRSRVELDDSEPSTFLTTVVLLLHEEIELIEAIHPGAILLLVVGEGLTQADHRHATFVLEGFH